MQRLGQRLGDRQHIGEVLAQDARCPLVSCPGALHTRLDRYLDGRLDMRDILRWQIADDGLPQTLRARIEQEARRDGGRLRLC